jgi:prepilin-type N-terminal cleavage/methylation domain-containing protein
MILSKLIKRERGFTLVEILVAILLLGIIGVAFFGGLSTASRVIILGDERATSESLARTEMEYVRNQDYYIAPWFYEIPPSTNPVPWDPTHTVPTGYDGYNVTVTAESLNDPDNGIQKITIIVEHPDKEVITLVSYKSAR